MNFVSNRIEREWNDPRLDAAVRQIVLDAQAHALAAWGWEFTITSIYRTPAEDAALRASGIHVEWRAVDVRVLGLPLAAFEDVTAYINARWAYDPMRPHLNVCFSEPHGTGPHCHFQSHPHTVRLSA